MSSIRLLRAALGASTLLLLAACADTSGTRGSALNPIQDIDIMTFDARTGMPVEGARCTVARNDSTLGTLTTPITLQISHSHYPLDITCRSAGLKGATKLYALTADGVRGPSGFAADVKDPDFAYPEKVRIMMFKGAAKAAKSKKR